MSLRILHVAASLAPRYGGPSVAAPQMCRALIARGHHVELFSTDRDGRGRLAVTLRDSEEHRGVPTTFFPVVRPRAYATSPQLARTLSRRIAEFDIVHVHSLYLFHSLVACSAARKHRVPYVIRPHGTLDPYHRSIRSGRKAVYTVLVERRNLERADAVHCTSEQEAVHVLSAFPHARTIVVPLGVSVPPPTGVPSWFPGLGRSRLVTFLGRLTSKKRPVSLVDGFARIAAEHVDAQLVFAGPDDEGLGARVLGRAQELGISNRVVLLGTLNREGAWELLARSALFVLPSVDENFGVAAVEAMASGVPVIVTEGVSIHREVAASAAGLVVGESPGDLASAIGSILADPAGAARMGENGRRLARSTFDWGAVAEELETAYRGLIQ